LLPTEGGAWFGGWRLNAPPTIRLVSDDGERSVAVEPGSAAHRPALALEQGVAHVDVDGRSVAFRRAPPPDVDRAARAASGVSLAGSVELIAPMPGSVLRVHVEDGADVSAGDPLVTLEAMKMEHVVPAPIAGRLGGLAVKPGDQVTRGQPLGSVTVRA
jgi:biotin carboxyl carrier protein